MKSNDAKLRLMAIVVAERNDNGWYIKGASHIARELVSTKDAVMKSIHELHGAGMLKLLHDATLNRVVGVRVTEEGHMWRLKMHKLYFPDLKITGIAAP